MEDQDSVRELTSEALRASGYNLIEAINGREADEIARRHDGPIDLLVTDVVMPQMGGRELAERLVLRFPQLKVLYVSGYAEYAVKKRQILDENTILLQKPFSMSALVLKVREVLDMITGAADVSTVERLPEKEVGT